MIKLLYIKKHFEIIPKFVEYVSSNNSNLSAHVLIKLAQYANGKLLLQLVLFDKVK